MKDKLEQELKPGDDVLIIVPENRWFHGADGIVKTVGEKVTVEFAAHMCPLGENRCDFEGEELQKIDLTEYPERRANRSYGHENLHHVFALKYKFSPKNPCMYNDCKEKATKRILFNVWGSVYEHDVCDQHAEKDGHYGDEFNMKDDYQAVDKPPRN